VTRRLVRTCCDPAFPLQAFENLRYDWFGEAKVGCGLGGLEWCVSPGVPTDHITEGIGNRLEEGGRYTRRRLDTECVSEASYVLDGRPTLRSCDPHRHCSPTFLQGSQPISGDFGIGEPRRHLLSCQWPEIAKGIVESVDASDATVGRQPLQLEFDRRQHIGVQQIAELGVAEQLTE
jgi:hypothetical protein